MLLIFLNKIKVVILFFVGLIKRSLCCLRRRRKFSADSIPLTGIGVIPNRDPTLQDLDNWSTWGEDQQIERQPQTVQEHIDHYRRQTSMRTKSESELPPPASTNYFQDMEPDIKRQTKVLLKSKDLESKDVSSRLSFVPDAALPNDGGELGTWEDKEKRSQSWAEAESWDADRILRENRREEQKKRIMEKEQQHRRGLASRIS